MIHCGDVLLPNGRVVHGQLTAHYESDTNAYYEVGDPLLEWADSGEQLTADDCNAEIEVDGKKWFVGEYIIDQLFDVPGEEPDWGEL